MLPQPVLDRARALARERQEAAPWLELWQKALSTPPWHRTVKLNGAAERPLLAGAEVTIHARSLARAVRALVTTTHDSRTLIEAAIAHDELPDELGPIAQLAAMPLLHALRQAHPTSPSWQHGHCPLCGDWPALAELRGLERERHLRCGRCGSDWRSDARCPSCGARELALLVPESDPESRRVETCSACNSYVKTITTIAPIMAEAVPLEDLATVELDLAALDRGYARPPARHAARVTLTAEKTWWS